MLRVERFKGIYLHRNIVDFRKSINGLAIIVEEDMKLDLFEPYLFLFCNKRRNMLKVLYWDATGFALWHKRLEKDRFIWPRKFEEDVIQVNHQQLTWLLGGYNIWKMKPHKKMKYSRIS